MIELEFSHSFKVLTGVEPLSWQTRLFREHFAKAPASLPSVIDLPTGLGKTMIMAIWLIARSSHPESTPTRLIYVVDRRTVVDQATDFAEDLSYLLAPKNSKRSLESTSRKPEVVERKLRHADSLSNLHKRLELATDGLAISTLRGQLADNREWSRDPTRPAIIIGTVDLIGSALLFSGYRSGYKAKPLHAGLLGQDSLLVLDEAHLSKPFDKLLSSIEQFQTVECGTCVSQVKPLQVIRMSATSGNSSEENTFKLDSTDDADPIVHERFTAKKRLTITALGEKDNLNAKLKDAAIELVDLSKHPMLHGKRIVVFVRKPDDARKIADAIRGNGSTKAKPDPFLDSVAVLTGTLRGLERDELVENPVLKRFLDGNEKPDENQDPVFLISTSAGEVGFDLNADHLVCDLAPLDSLIQRLGRVNRRGLGDATIQLFAEVPQQKKNKDGKLQLLSPFEVAIKTTFDLLIGKCTDSSMDVSPKSLAEFKSTLTAELLKAASTPVPTMVDLTDILLDNWSMTSITGRMPGRPSVGPWLRGIDDEQPQTTIAWRAELDLPGFSDLDPEYIEEWFDTHRIMTHESLSVPTSSKSEGSAEKWLQARWKHLRETLGDEPIRHIAALPVVVDCSGFEVVRLGELLRELERGNFDNIRNANLVLPASFGGIERGTGLLDNSAPEIPKNEHEKPIDDQRQARANRLIAPDVADIAPSRQRLREVITKSEQGTESRRNVAPGQAPSKPLTHRVDLEYDDEKRITLVSYIPRREKPEFGSSEPETLASHVEKVRKSVNTILGRLTITDDINQAARFAADYHDHGKNRVRWQRSVNGTATVTFTNGNAVSNTDWLHQITLEDHGRHQSLGKSGGEMKRDGRGYRHEFGSLREFTDAFNAGKLLNDQGKPISQDVFDLAMHMIAAHHGRGRPHFPKGGFDPDAESRSDDIHTAAIQRFARLQKKYGWWQLAWLENLLRCADAAASAVLETEEELENEMGGDA